MTMRVKIFGHSQAKWFSNYLPEFGSPDLEIHAFPGYRVDDMWAAIKGDVVGAEIIALIVGANDIGREMPAVTLERIQTLCEDIWTRNPGTSILLSSVLPRVQSDDQVKKWRFPRKSTQRPVTVFHLPYESEGPVARSGHRIVVDDADLYTIGGYNPEYLEIENDDITNYPIFTELWKFNFSSRKWSKLNTAGVMPKELASHSALLHGRYLVVFGGTGIPFGTTASNSLHVCNLDTLEWKTIECTGSLPGKVYGHSMLIRDGSLCVFGGTTGWEYYADLHILDLKTNQWKYVKANPQPPGRYRHEMACDDRYLYVFGGGRSYASYKFEKIHAFDLLENKWELLKCKPDTKNINGYPPARRCHSCVQFKNEVYMCGGYNGERIFGDLWKINLSTLEWTVLPASLPRPVYFHSAAITLNGCMYIYGGVCKIDTERTSDVYMIWLTVPPLKELCWNAVSQSIADLDSVSKEELYEVGVPKDMIARVG